jgi:diacylglycerol kinase (ATP)
MRRVLLFLNPLLIDNAKRRSTVGEIAELLSAHGCEVYQRETLSAHLAGEQAREAVAEGIDTFLVCGGDGTFFQVMQGVAGSKATLGVLPFGTGNVIAQNLRIPRDPLKAAHLLLNAETRTATLGKIELHAPGHKRRSWYFFIAAGMGVHAALMNLAPTGQGKRRGGRLAYFAGGMKVLLDQPVQPFALEMTRADGSRETETACEAIATHVREINRWHPGGDPFGSELRVAWVPPTTRLGLGHASFHALATRRQNGHYGWGGLPFPRYERVRRIVCGPFDGKAYDPPLLVEADGEVLGASYTAIGMAEETLNLLWPRD